MQDLNFLPFAWSSNARTDRVPVEDPAAGEVTAVVQGGGPEEVGAAVEAAHRSRPTGAGGHRPSAPPCCFGAWTCWRSASEAGAGETAASRHMRGFWQGGPRWQR